MDNPKQAKPTGKGDVPPKAGLSKKERRALKVREKQEASKNITVNTNTQTKVNPTDIIGKQIKDTPVNDIKPKEKQKIKKEATSNVANNVVSNAEEKELRRKEWEKKLGEQKTEISEKQNKEGLNKAQLKAKRREMQEAQRSAKATVSKEVEKQPVVKQQQTKPEPKPPIKKETRKQSVSKVQLVHHLYIERTKTSDCENSTVNLKDVHPSFIKLGVQYASNTILGSNARCLALLAALKLLVEDVSAPPKQEFCRYLESTLQYCVAYLQHSRPIAVSMTNALRHFKLNLTQVDVNLSETEKKSKLIDVINTYVYEDIAKAGEAISLKVTEKICNGDVILTYGCSSLIKQILMDAHKKQIQFEVIIVDGRPLLEGREMLRRLTKAGIQCTYVVINAVSFVMSSCTKVLLGAHALLANGYVMSRMGTAQVALIAKAYNKPVLVCCETYKFSEKVQTDSFVYNEIGNPDKLVHIDTVEEVSPLANWKSSSYLTPLNLLYDVTPPDLVTAVVTELGFLPCTSVPVVLRIRPVERF